MESTIPDTATAGGGGAKIVSQARETNPFRKLGGGTSFHEKPQFITEELLFQLPEIHLLFIAPEIGPILSFLIACSQPVIESPCQGTRCRSFGSEIVIASEAKTRLVSVLRQRSLANDVDYSRENPHPIELSRRALNNLNPLHHDGIGDAPQRYALGRNRSAEPEAVTRLRIDPEATNKG